MQTLAQKSIENENKSGDNKLNRNSKNNSIENSYKTESSSGLYLRREIDFDIQYALKKVLKVNLMEFSDPETVRDSVRNFNVQFYLLDMFSALYNNSEILNLIGEYHPRAEIMIIVNKGEESHILDLIDRGITKFIKTPVDFDDFLKKAKSIIDRSKNYKIDNLLSNSSTEVLKKQLEWMNYKNIKKNIGVESAGKNIIENLRDSLVQVGGFGVILSMLDVVNELSEKKGNNYIVDKQMMEILFDNSRIAARQLNGVNLAISIMSDKYFLEESSSYAFLRKIPELLEETAKMAMETNNYIYFPKLSAVQDVKLLINHDLLSLAVEELAVNAVKYTKPDSPIHMFASVSEGYFCLSVMNEYSEMQIEPIKDEDTELLVKPFLRKHPPADRYIETERIGMGLGLTAVYFIVGQLNGIFSISSVKDHTEENIKSCVLTRMFIPICE